MVGKVKAAVDARASVETLIVARIDVVVVEGFEPALERVEVYLAAGVDVLFIEALRFEVEMCTATVRFAGRALLLANMVEGGKIPVLSVAEFERLGFVVGIFPNNTT